MNTMKKTTWVVVAMLCTTVIISASCSKSSEDKLSSQTPTVCDTANSTYTADVVPILQANCYSCHGNGNVSGGVSLDNYNNVKSLAQSGDLLGVINHTPGYPPMPEGGAKLSDCDINTIKSWIDNGVLNN